MKTDSDIAVSSIPNLVVIGASAGGLKAMKQFFSAVKDPSYTSYVVVQHLDPYKKDLALESIKRITSLPVREMENNLTLEAGVVYVIPPHSVPYIEHDKFFVKNIHDHRQRSSVIDATFSLIGEVYAHKAIGVILSGEGSDGLQGLKVISEKGGMTIAQHLDSAEYPGMPTSAIASGIVDHVLHPENMSDEIMAYEKYLQKMSEKAAMSVLHAQIGSCLPTICDILYQHTHHDFKHYKISTLIRRIIRRMQILQLVSVDEYIERLKEQRDEVTSLYNELLINVTSFFRDPESFKELNEKVLSTLIKNNINNEKIRIWIAGCSTGEEAYTLAILIKEHLEKMALPPEVQIMATDIDDHALSIARKGAYSASIVSRVSDERLAKYFTKRGGKYHISREIRELCLFSSHNLIHDPPFSQVDLISCRNVLIYMGAHLQKKLVPTFHYALKPNGYLFLGASESLSLHKELFQTLSAKYRIAQRKATAIGVVSSFSSPNGSFPYAIERKKNHDHEIDLHLITQRIILDEFAPKYVVISDDGQVISLSSGLQEYLEPSEGSFQNNIFRLVKPGLRIALRSTFTESRRYKRKFEHEGSTLKTAEGMQKISIVVQPMPELGEDTSLYMVVFKKLGKVSTDNFDSESDIYIEEIGIIEQLEKELITTREDLDKTVQDLEASNEELKSSNEELLSMNEELQSVNEELEASKEELQMANEAIQRSYTDLENLLSSTQIATLFLDNDFKIRSFTPAVARLYRIKPVDIGREISDISHDLIEMTPYPDPTSLTAFDTVQEVELKTSSGDVYLRRISPYKTHDQKKDGMVVTFIDITELRKTEERFRALVKASSHMVWTTNAQGQVIDDSQSWRSFTGQTYEEWKNEGWVNAIHPDDQEASLRAWRQATDTKTPYQVEYRLRHHSGEWRWTLVRGVPLLDSQGNLSGWVGMNEDITARKEKDHQIQMLASVVEASTDFIAVCTPDMKAAFVNRGGRNLVGLNENEVLQTKVMDYFPPSEHQKVLEEVVPTVEKTGYWEGELLFRHFKTEALIPVLYNIFPIFDETTGKLLYYATVTRDITEMKRIEAARKENEQHLQLALSATNLGTFFWNFFTGEVQWSDQTYKIYGYQEERPVITVESALSIIHPDDLDVVQNVIDNVLEHDDRIKVEYRIVLASGAIRWLINHGQMIRDDLGQPKYMLGTVQDITDRKLAQLEFERSVDNSPAILWITQADHNCSYLSRQWYEVTGQTLEASLGFGWLDAVHPEDAEKTKSTFLRASERQEPFDCEFRLRTKSGEYRWSIDAGNPRFDSAGTFLGFAGSVLDIHDRKMAEQMISESQQRYQTMTEVIPQLVWTCRPDGFCDYMSRQWFDYTGKTSDALLGFCWLEQIHPEDRTKTYEHWMGAVAGQNAYDIEYRILRHDGEYRWFKARGTAIKNSSNEIVYWFGTSTEIHEQISMEKEIVDTLESMSDAFFSMDRNWNIIRVNAYMEKVVKKNREEMINRNFLDLFFPEPRPLESLYLKNYFKAMHDRIAVQFEDYYEPLRVWTSVSVYPKVDGGLAVFFRDVTQEKLAEEKLHEAISLRDEFMSIASHELKTPLTSLIMQSQLQKRMMDNDDPRAFTKERFKQLNEQYSRLFGRLNRLIEDMLDISRIRTGKLKIEKDKFDLFQLTKDTVMRMEDAFIAAECGTPEIFGEEVVGHWDPIRIEQVVMNLLTNAIRYGQGKAVFVEVKIQEGKALLAVKDNGIGISEIDRGKIFQRFERAVNANEISGLGLGLFISDQIIKGHDGRIWVESELGKGSTFYVELPLNLQENKE
jgi:two-component system, chemotaxis family, CheB/CheR fusion protein